MNPLFDGSQQNQTPNPFQNFSETMNAFNQFRNNFRGNPQQIVMSLLSNGQMSKEQFNYLSNLAHQFRNMMR